MTPEVKRTPCIKACPWWARFATGPNDWIIAHCSLYAHEEGKKNGGVWEGPPKERRCFLGYNKDDAAKDPAIIFHNPRSLFRGYLRAENHWISDKSWNYVVEVFMQEAAKIVFFQPNTYEQLERLETRIREAIIEAWRA